MVLLKNGSCIQIVSSLTTLATVNNQLTALGRAELAGVVQSSTTERATKAIGMKVLNDPLGTTSFIE